MKGRRDYVCMCPDVRGEVCDCGCMIHVAYALMCEVQGEACDCGCVLLVAYALMGGVKHVTADVCYMLHMHRCAG